MNMTLSSPAFEHGGDIPDRYTCDGDDVSPPLEWDDVPDGTRSIALIADDPDAPAGTWVHWVLYGLGPDVRELPESLPPDEELADGSRQGRNSFRRTGYGGPCPPQNGPHRYFFRVYALDAEPDLGPRATKEELLDATGGHVLAQGERMGRYARK